jgi:hypothetical protein
MQNMGVHVIKFPSGLYGFVGSLPTVLATPRPATYADVMAGRAFKRDGELLTWQFPAFDLASDARDYASSRGVQLQSSC